MNPMPAPSLFKIPPSRLTLGTVQFGIDYGIANRTGKPSLDTVCEIVREAYHGGVDTLDTAAAYGQSEEVLGLALRQIGLADKIRVVTKVAAMPADLSKGEAAARIEASVVKSLKLLNLQQLPLCLFHRQESLIYTDELLALRDRGLIEAAGVSLINGDGAKAALKFPELKAWQVPSNLLDRRFTHTGLTEAAHQAGKLVFVRSTYLQGLLVMDDAAVPKHLHEAVTARRPFRDLADRIGIPHRELALRAMLSRPDLSALVVGVETVGQMKDNLALFAKGALSADIMAQVNAIVPQVSHYLINPFEWEKIVPPREVVGSKKV